jgi:hypothetical protein
MSLTADEKTRLVQVFEEIGVKPKTDSVQDFESWMKSYLETKGDIPGNIHVVTQPPQIVKFSGDSKGDQASFDLWRYEVQSLKKEQLHKPETIYQAVRRSLRGEASRVAMRLGSEASLDALLKKLEGIYGTIDFGEDILAQFYSASQKDGESVVTWGFRLENILDKAIEQKQITETTATEMLRSKFWTGLQQHLKDATRHYFEKEKDYDKLRVEVRRVEQEHGSPDSSKNQVKDKKMASSKVHTTDSSSSQEIFNKQISELQELMKGFNTKVDSLQEEVKKIKGKQENDPPIRGKPHFSPKPPTHDQAASEQDEPRCYKCGQSGHLSFGCRTKKPLNC